MLNKYNNILISTSLEVDMTKYINKITFRAEIAFGMGTVSILKKHEDIKRFQTLQFVVYILYPYLDTLRFARMVVVVLNDVIGLLLNSCHNFFLLFIYTKFINN